MRVHRGRAVGAAVAGLTAAALAGAVGTGTAGASGTPIGFVNFSLGTSPATGYGPTCPTDGSQCTNTAAEPAIRADKAGNFFASSENGLGAGTEAWRSTTNGTTYRALSSPNQTAPGLGAAGGDTDIAVATQQNSGHRHYNVYVASLNLGSVFVSTSRDGGATWAKNPAAATQAGDDREWIAAYGQSNVCISYHAISENDQIAVQCSADAGRTFTSSAVPGAIDLAHAYDVGANEIGNLAVANSGLAGQPPLIYQTFSGVDNATESAQCQSTGPCNYRDVFMAVSSDGGRTFTDYLVHRGSPTTSYGHQFVNVSVDRAGNVYSVYSDDHNLFYSYSTDHGQHWSSARQVNTGTSKTAIEPWSSAGQNGKIDIVWYGTSYYQPGTPPDSYPATAQWQVYFAQSLQATTTRTFTQTIASPVNHTGGVCESGVGCTGNRDLFDDFGVAASPTTGYASIVYSDDQYDARPGAPNGPNCTALTTSTSSCNHTAIATQVSGSRIFGG